MEEKHSILYNHYSKYKAGNTAILRSVGSVTKNLLTKLPGATKSILKDVINDLPGKMKDEFRDRITSNLLQGKNPITELTSDIKNRVYNDLIKDGHYDINELNILFNKPISSNVAKIRSPFSIDYNNLDNLDYKVYSKSDDSESSDESDKRQLYGGSIYKNKYYKYKCKNL
jgi:hypothetical protein